MSQKAKGGWPAWHARFDNFWKAVKSYRFILAIACPAFVGGEAKAQSPFKAFENLFAQPRSYIVAYTKTAPVIDGDISDAVWQQAAWTDDFADIEGDLKPNPPLRTRAKMLWDDTCLYIAAEISDPDVWATLTHHDDIIFRDNDFEVFIDPTNNTHQYYELEFNAINTVFDLFLNKPYRNGGNAMINWDATGLRTAVKIQGTLNNPSDKDKGWTIEIAIPFRAITVGNGRRPPADGALWRINFSRVEWDIKVVNGKYIKLTDASGHNLPEHNWVWSPQGVVNMHFPERWGYLLFTKNAGAVKTFVLPYTEKQRQYLWLVYYSEQQAMEQHGAYNSSLSAFNLNDTATIDGRTNKLQIEATPHQFMALITDMTTGSTLTINQEGFIQRLK